MSKFGISALLLIAILCALMLPMIACADAAPTTEAIVATETSPAPESIAADESTTAVEEEEAPTAAQINAASLTFWTLLPPLIAIALAFITKNVIFSLFMGVLSGTFLLSITNDGFLGAIWNSFFSAVAFMLDSLADSWNAGIILQVMAIGGLIAIVTRMGGARAVAEKLSKYAKNRRSAQVITWLMGLLIFFDDYANSLIIGPIMRQVTDKLKISREKLAFIVDATAAPVAGIALVSTWIGYEMSTMRSGFELAGIAGNPYSLFLDTIPYRFYNILILAFILLVAFLGRDIGPMLKAENRALGGQPETDPTELIDDPMTTSSIPVKEAKVQPSSVWFAIVPIGTLIICSLFGFYMNGYFAILGGDDSALISIVQSQGWTFTAIRECFSSADAAIVLFQAALFAGIVGIVMGICSKIFTLAQALETWVDGLKALMITCVILILAWSLSGTIKSLGTATYLSTLVTNALPTQLLPALIFILGSVISFATGTSYGTMGILMPLAIPIANSVVPGDYNYLVMCASGVLTGAIFGDHCSPISDTTILSSMGAGCDHIAHVSTQMVYALIVAGVTVVCGYLPLGYGVSIWIVLPLCVAVLAGILLIFGKKPRAQKA